MGMEMDKVHSMKYLHERRTSIKVDGRSDDTAIIPHVPQPNASSCVGTTTQLVAMWNL